MTDEQKQLWLEGAEEYGDALQDRSLVPVMEEDEIDVTVSMPALKYDKDPTLAGAQPVGFRQVFFKTFWNRVAAMAQTVADAVSDLLAVKSDTLAARDAANTAASTAERKSNAASEAAALASEAAALANEKAAYAQTQGDYAKNQIEGAENVNAVLNGTTLSVTDRNGSTKTVNVKGEKGDPGKDLDYGSMTEEEKQALEDAVTDRISQEGGYALLPVDESTLSPSSTFVKNAIICIDGVIYKAKKETNTLPFNFMADDGKFVVQTILGHTCFVKVSNTINSDWEVWIDASCDLRFKQLEERVARLETIINSL